MGHGVTTYAAPHVINTFGKQKDWVLAVCERPYWVETEQERLYEEALDEGKSEDEADAIAEAFNPKTFEVNGWSTKLDVNGEDWESKHRDGIYGSILRKGDKEVYVLNSDRYSNVGEFTLTAWSDNLEALTEFWKDAELTHVGITSPGVVAQWG